MNYVTQFASHKVARCDIIATLKSKTIKL